MKYCPSCQTVYADESLRFCLQDGTGLRDSAENAPPPTQDMRELETFVRQVPVTSGWKPNRVTRGTNDSPEVKKSNTLLAVIATAAVMTVFFGGIGALWLLLGGKQPENNNLSIVRTSPTNPVANTGIKKPDQVNVATPRLPPPTNTDYSNTDLDRQSTDDARLGGIGWKPIDFNASLDGERLTYYRGTIAGQCQKDCLMNPNCQAFTLIRAGFYNPQDPPMCYLMRKVTGSNPSSCCISGIKD